MVQHLDVHAHAHTLPHKQNTTPNPISAKTGTFANMQPLAALFYNVTTPQTVAAVTPTHLTLSAPAQRGRKKARRLLSLPDYPDASAHLIKSGIFKIVSIWKCCQLCAPHIQHLHCFQEFQNKSGLFYLSSLASF